MRTYDPTYKQTLVDRMDRLTAAIQSRGLPQTFLNVVIKGDPAWTRDYRTRDFRVAIYDRVVQRLSAIWPQDLEWPSDIPRLEPADIEPELLAEVAERLAKSAQSMEGNDG